MRIYLGVADLTADQLADFDRLDINLETQRGTQWLGRGQSRYINQYVLTVPEDNGNHLKTLEMCKINQTDPNYTYVIFYGDEPIITIKVQYDRLNNSSSQIIMDSQKITEALAKNPATFTGSAYEEMSAAYQAANQARRREFVLWSSVKPEMEIDSEAKDFDSQHKPKMH